MALGKFRCGFKKFRCGVQKFRCGVQEINYRAHRSARNAMILSKTAYLYEVEIMLVYTRLRDLEIMFGTRDSRCGANSR